MYILHFELFNVFPPPWWMSLPRNHESFGAISRLGFVRVTWFILDEGCLVRKKKSLYVEGQFVSIAPHLTNMGYIMTLLETICLWQTFSCHVHAFSPPSWMSLCRHHKSFVLRAMLHQCKLNHYGRWGSSKNMPPLKWEHVCSQMGLARFIGILMPFYSQSILIEVFML